MINKYIRKCSTSLNFKKMLIKTILRFYLTSIRTNAGKDAGKKEYNIYTIVGNAT
jgi:hypothetical protein